MGSIRKVVLSLASEGLCARTVWSSRQGWLSNRQLGQHYLLDAIVDYLCWQPVVTRAPSTLSVSLWGETGHFLELILLNTAGYALFCQRLNGTKTKIVSLKKEDFVLRIGALIWHWSLCLASVMDLDLSSPPKYWLPCWWPHYADWPSLWWLLKPVTMGLWILVYWTD